MSEQSAQVALKAYLIYKTGRYTSLHLKKLAERCLEQEKEFIKVVEYKILDRYCIPTRYPDALAPPAIPAEIYTKKDAKETLEFVKEILKIVKEKIEGIRDGESYPLR
jgi:HEPN domain-containing protein